MSQTPISYEPLVSILQDNQIMAFHFKMIDIHIIRVYNHTVWHFFRYGRQAGFTIIETASCIKTCNNNLEVWIVLKNFNTPFS